MATGPIDILLTGDGAVQDLQDLVKVRLPTAKLRVLTLLAAAAYEAEDGDPFERNVRLVCGAAIGTLAGLGLTRASPPAWACGSASGLELSSADCSRATLATDFGPIGFGGCGRRPFGYRLSNLLSLSLRFRAASTTAA
jgi:hypothetical protein